MSDTDRTPPDIVAEIIAIWGDYDDFKEGGLEYVTFVQEQNLEEMRESDFEEETCVNELADQAIVSLRQLYEMGYNPYEVISGRLDNRMNGNADDIISRYQADFAETRDHSNT